MGTGHLLWRVHSISAFCNAGFDLFGNYASLTGFARTPWWWLTIAMLIILGGLGFSVLFEAVHCMGAPRRRSLHTRLVLGMPLLLLVVGTLFYLRGWNGTIRPPGAEGRA